MASFVRMRYVIVGLALVLAVVLILNGNLLIGGLVGAMAVMRAVMVTRIQQRRRQFRAARGDRGPDRPS
jgi:Na+-driven multidrug efflux pump